jgi:hypothetical protein
MSASSSEERKDAMLLCYNELKVVADCCRREGK